MTSNLIYTTLKLKSKNEHYLIRYCNFIRSLSTQLSSGGTEAHHICPVGEYPEYSDFELHPWNCVHLTKHQHFIAHWMLWKILGLSQTRAFNMMSTTRDGIRIKSGRVFAQLKDDYHAEQIRLAELGLHANQTQEFRDQQRAVQNAIVAAGEHHWLTEEHSIFKSEMEKKRYEDGTHPWCSKEFQEENGARASARQKALVDAGVHIWQSEECKAETSRRLLELSAKGEHPFQDAEFKARNSARQKELSAKGEHHTQQKECIELHKEGLLCKRNRNNVAILKGHAERLRMVLGSGYDLKSDEWINEKIKELELIEYIEPPKAYQCNSDESLKASGLRIKNKSNRECVVELRLLAKDKNVTLSRGYSMKPDEWILEKIKEIQKL